jgi:prolyl oligopeptidase
MIHSWSFCGERLGAIDIPAKGSVQLLGNLHANEESLFYTYESFSQPSIIFECTENTNKSQLWYRPPSSSGNSDLHIRNTFYPSKDGVTIPLTLVALEEASFNGPAAVIMTSYGGFGVSATPQFSVLVKIMLNHGVVFALPHIRGGGEYGKPWHDAGRAGNRQTSFDDFLAAAEWLCLERVTTPRQLGIFGGSNSGLLVAAAMIQRPDLFGAVLCIAPLLDMVRYEVFDQAHKWRREYGSAEQADEFHVLYAYSPYHHIDAGVNYPPVMFVTGDKDDRCNPAHVRKMVARLKEYEAQDSPVLVDYNEQRGHFPVLPLSTRIDALAKKIAFLCRELNIPISD